MKLGSSSKLIFLIGILGVSIISLPIISCFTLTTTAISASDMLDNFAITDKQNPVVLTDFARNHLQQRISAWGHAEVIYLSGLFKCIENACKLEHFILDVQASTNYYILPLGKLYSLTEYGFDIRNDRLNVDTVPPTSRSPYGVGGNPELNFSKAIEIALNSRIPVFLDSHSDYTMSIEWQSYPHLPRKWIADFYDDNGNRLKLEIDVDSSNSHQIQ